MAKKAKQGRPPKPYAEKLSHLYGVRFTPSDHREIVIATMGNDELVTRIRAAILAEVRKKTPRKKPKPRRL